MSFVGERTNKSDHKFVIHKHTLKAKMISKWMYVFAILIVLDYSGLNPAEACSCMPEHPQAHFCKSDFAVIARVKRQVKSDQNMNNIYRVVYRRIFKASEKARVAFKSSKVYTPSDESMCGQELQLNQTYLLTGYINHLQPHINICNYVHLWKTITPRQRKGFRLLYKQGCNCKILPRFGRRNHATATGVKHTCSWANAMTSEDCLSPYGICLINRMGRCSWAKSPVLSKCIRRNKTNLHPLKYSQT